MTRLLIRAAMFLGSAALGLLVAAAVVDGMSVSWGSFLVVVLVFAVLQSVLAPFMVKVTRRHAPALLGAAGLLSTVVALLVTSVGSDLRIEGGPGPWLLASVITWLATMVATLLLPIVLVRAGVERAAGRRGTTPV